MGVSTDRAIPFVSLMLYKKQFGPKISFRLKSSRGDPMRQRGRKSAEALAINVSGEPPRLTPPAGLNPKERAAFVELVNAADPRHFRRSDAPMIVALVQATIKARELGRDPAKTQDWERASRVMMALATKLRLTPQCRTRPESIARQHEVAPCHEDESWDDEPKPWPASIPGSPTSS
jgi:hypothetical protein